MTTYCAVVKYAIDADDKTKISLLRDGLGEVAAELINLGVSLERVEEMLHDAKGCAQDEATANAAFNGGNNDS